MISYPYNLPSTFRKPQTLKVSILVSEKSPKMESFGGFVICSIDAQHIYVTQIANTAGA
jgi:hypothetical protein